MLRESKMPLLLIFSENDKLVDTDISYELAEILGAQEENYSVFNHSSQTFDKERSSDSTPSVLVLPDGGHYSLLNFPQLVNESIEKFLHNCINSRTTDTD